jgi:hypothetical protein
VPSDHGGRLAGVDVLAVTNAVTGVAAVAFAALAWRENRRRTKAEGALNRERQRREDLAAQPAVVIDHREATWERPHPPQITLRVANKGPTVARDIRVSVLVANEWAHVNPIAALAPGESRDVKVVVGREQWEGLLLRGDTVLAKVHWLDQFGNQHSHQVEGRV